MLKIRVIPCLDVKEGRVVKGINFIDLKDAGDKVKIVGRWHHLNGAGGVCIAECSDSSALNSFMLNWAPMCDITVMPVVEDATARASLVGKPYFNKKE